MNTEKLYHYTYIITNVIENKYYIGCRSCAVRPENDLGVRYFSSSKDKKFLKDQKLNPQNYKYKVIAEFSSRALALDLEIKLHNIHNVAVNPCFYNRSKQTSVGWDTAGRVCTEETKKKISLAQIGKTIPLEVRLKHSEAIKGIKNWRAKLANIYDYKTNALIAENVVIREWARENNHNAGILFQTTCADRSLPSNHKNRHQDKGVYAVYT